MTRPSPKPPRTLFRLGLAQINTTVGDLSQNARKVQDYVCRAVDQGVDLVVFPEMVLTGYPPEDLLLKKSFVKAAQHCLEQMAKKIPGSLAVCVGSLWPSPQGLWNSAILIHDGKIRLVYGKKNLPNYGVFDEQRYFVPGTHSGLAQVGETPVGFTICEDIWVDQGPAGKQAQQKARLLVNLSSSPYHAGKIDQRMRLLKKRVIETRCFLAYCNLVGGQDELVFDGGSAVMNARGKVLAQAPQFKETLLTVDLTWPQSPRLKANQRFVQISLPQKTKRAVIHPAQGCWLTDLEEIYSALVLGTRDYVLKNGFTRTVIGLSGGIDSSLVACLAVDALGHDNVVGVTMPSRFNSPATQSDAQQLARNLNIEFLQLPIESMWDQFMQVLSPSFHGHPAGLTEENLQARIRGVLLMALSNKFGWLVLTTGNKSEISVGYCTLYGDTAGGFAVIKDIPKTWVYRLATWRNQKADHALIPISVLDRAPSAELRKNQKDADSLPPYNTLDPILKLAIEKDQGLQSIVKSGHSPEIVSRVLTLIDHNEYKRRQAPPGIRITPKAFGRDRRMPITNKWKAFQ